MKSLFSIEDEGHNKIKNIEVSQGKIKLRILVVELQVHSLSLLQLSHVQIQRVAPS